MCCLYAVGVGTSSATGSLLRPADAVESLHAAILRVETIAQIASNAVDQLSCPAQPDARRAFARMQILVGKAAEEASAALAEGDRRMAALTHHLQTRGTSREAALAKPPGL